MDPQIFRPPSQGQNILDYLRVGRIISWLEMFKGLAQGDYIHVVPPLRKQSSGPGGCLLAIDMPRYFGGGEAQDSRSFPLPFTVSPSGETTVRIRPGMLSGPSVPAGVGEGRAEIELSIGGVPLHLDPDFEVGASEEWQYLYVKMMFSPIVIEADGEYRMGGLELQTPTVEIGQLPNTARFAEVDAVTGETTDGETVKTLALIRAKPRVVIQLSYGNWYLQTCKDDQYGHITIYEPTYLNQTVQVGA
jgi:hypothetical protein